ncbi:MAG: 3-hydroxybutyrate oligomer hydrolase family protein, partial [Wenzhouxiangella sp.]
MLTICRILSLLAAFFVVACQPPPESDDDREGFGGLDMQIRTTDHRDGDDLLTAGLGVDGLRDGAPEARDPAQPSPETLRRMAVHAAWNGLYSLTPAGGVGGLLAELPSVPGREFHAFDQVSGAVQPFRVMLQLPDAFDTEQPCLVVAPASGSRGIYGALPVVAPWALPAGCAVVYTDKGAGTDFFDFSADRGVGLSGQRVDRGEGELGFEPVASDSPSDAVAMPHLHSEDHPEADWGRHVLRAVRFGLGVLARESDLASDPDNFHVIAAGLSNGGGAVLRAAEQDREGLLDAVVAVAPNVTAPGAPPLFDYASLAALYQPCTLADAAALESMPLADPALATAGERRCKALAQAGLLDDPEPAQARERLLEAGFDEPALEQAAVNAALDIWRTVAVGYASAYLRRGPREMPCGYAITAADATPAQRNAWWATHPGIGVGSGIELDDALA